MKSALKKAFVPTESEIAANHTGLNTFFGAVLGFVMAGSEKLDQMEFAYLLFMVAGIVISILYVSASRQKAIYGALSVMLILVLPRLMDGWLDPGEQLPPKLQATLLVWTAMSMFVEFLPRRSDDPLPAAKKP